jgi:hypothetical protein
MKYKVSYTYDNPSGAGPFKGKMTIDYKVIKGDTIFAYFGRATVVSCRVVKE